MLIIKIFSIMNSHALKGISAVYSEDSIQSRFAEYSDKIFKMAIGEAVFKNPKEEEELMKINQSRIDAWKETSSYKDYLLSRKNQIAKRKIKGFDTEKFITRLRLCKRLSETELIKDLQILVRQVKTEDQVYEVNIYSTVITCISV